jgi:hypothetical protein
MSLRRLLFYTVWIAALITAGVPWWIPYGRLETTLWLGLPWWWWVIFVVIPSITLPLYIWFYRYDLNDAAIEPLLKRSEGK